MNSFFTALALLTCLGPARSRSQKELERSVPLFPLIGLLIGACLLVPQALGLAAQQPWVQAWLYVALGMGLTRCLHWDGLADLADAWGSGAEGEGFASILKDSRTGAFGALALCMGVLGQIIFAQAHFAQQNFTPLLLAPCLGRAFCVALAALERPRTENSLGALVTRGAKPLCSALSLFLILLLCAFCLGWQALLALLPLLAALLFFLRALARRAGGINGDFLGASIILSELALLLAALCQTA